MLELLDSCAIGESHCLTSCEQTKQSCSRNGRGLLWRGGSLLLLPGCVAAAAIHSRDACGLQEGGHCWRRRCRLCGCWRGGSWCGCAAKASKPDVGLAAIPACGSNKQREGGYVSVVQSGSGATQKSKWAVDASAACMHIHCDRQHTAAAAHPSGPPGCASSWQQAQQRRPQQRLAPPPARWSAVQCKQELGR